MFAVIGHPIEHSLSPELHKIAFRMMDLDLCYTKIDVPPEKLDDFMKAAPLIFKGLNVTIPHKEKVMKYCERVDPLVEEVKATNTLKFGDVTECYNTDVKGVRISIEDVVDPKGKKVAIVGAGGAARAAVVAFYKDAEVAIFNRTFEKAQKLAKEFGVSAFPLSKYELLRNYDIIINATPVGMDGKSTPFPPDVLREGQVVMDMVYRPLYTPLLLEAIRRGAIAVNGLKMLVIQGVESERVWLGRAPPWRSVYSKLLVLLSSIITS